MSARAEYLKRYYEANREKILAKNAAYKAANPEAVKAGARKHAAANKESIAASQAAYRLEHKAERAAYTKARYEANKPAVLARQATYQRVNKDAVNAKNREWAHANPLKVRVRCALRRRRVRQATPVWADVQAIRDAYVEAAHMQLHVDHIIPLKHPLVCGLHVWGNLQLLSETANKAKGNSFAVGTQP